MTELELRVGRGRDDRPPILLDVDLDDPADVIAEQIYDASLPFLISTCVEATWDPETRTGRVYAGAHCVGEAQEVSE